MITTISTPKKKSGGGMGKMLRTSWAWLSQLHGGKWAFSKMIGFKAPYTGTIDGRVVTLTDDGFCQVHMRDRWIVRNFVPSVHAVAQTNLGEMTSGLAILHSMPAGMRGIVKRLSTEYFKPAHGTLIAICQSPIVYVRDKERDYEVTAFIYSLASKETPGAVLLDSRDSVISRITDEEGCREVYGLLVSVFSAIWDIRPVKE